MSLMAAVHAIKASLVVLAWICSVAPFFCCQSNLQNLLFNDTVLYLPLLAATCCSPQPLLASTTQQLRHHPPPQQQQQRR